MRYRTTSLGLGIACTLVATSATSFAYESFPPWTMISDTEDSMCMEGAGNGLEVISQYPCDQSNYFQFFQHWGNPGTIEEWDGSCVYGGVGVGFGEQDFLQGGNCDGSIYEDWFQDSSGKIIDQGDQFCFYNGLFQFSKDGFNHDATEVKACGWEFESLNGTVTGSNPTPYVPYTIQPYSPSSPNICLDVFADGRANGTPVDVTTCNGTPAQYWWYDPGTREIHLSDSNDMCLDKPLGQNADGTTLEIWQCNGGVNQQWVSVYPSQWVNVESGTCLDPGLNQLNVDAKVWTCWGGINQQWRGPQG
jgi:hypothetical protein